MDFRPLFGVAALIAVAAFGVILVLWALLRPGAPSRGRMRTGIIALAISVLTFAVWAGYSALS